MIARLHGVLVELEGSLAVVDAAGVGYEVSLPDSVTMQMPQIGQEVTLVTRQIFREDGTSLYGFLSRADRRLFDLLLLVKGCGPKVGLSLIGQVGPDTIAQTILVQDPKPLIRATGVGARLAERIVLELKDKIQEEALMRKVAPAAAPAPESELVDALLQLGYRRTEADAAAQRTNPDGPLEDRIREALRLLRK